MLYCIFVVELRKIKLNRIKTVLIEKDLSQKWLAEQLGKSFSTN